MRSTSDGVMQNASSTARQRIGQHRDGRDDGRSDSAVEAKGKGNGTADCEGRREQVAEQATDHQAAHRAEHQGNGQRQDICQSRADRQQGSGWSRGGQSKYQSVEPRAGRRRRGGAAEMAVVCQLRRCSIAVTLTPIQMHTPAPHTAHRGAVIGRRR